jgi:tetratricopeptide (TPR) repeat protein
MLIDTARRLQCVLVAGGFLVAVAAFSAPGFAQDSRGGIDQLLPRDEGQDGGAERLVPRRGPEAPGDGQPGDGLPGDGGANEEQFGADRERDGGEPGRGQADAGAAKPVPQSPLDLIMKDGVPKHAAKRAVLRDDLYALLATAATEDEAKRVARQLQRVWAETGSDTAAVLLSRAAQAFKAKNNALALELLDAVVELKPDHAEAWNRRAYVHFQMNNYTAAVGDLRRALALDENHFKALDGLATIFQQMGDEAKALSVYEKLQGVHPFWPGLDDAIRTLRDKVEGRGI